mgnify:CR=1 FL=1
MKAIVLCGGKGSRLAEETKLIPKPMVKIGGIPIIIHIIKYLKFYGFNEILLATGYKSEIIDNYFKKNKIKNIKSVYTGKESLTGGRLLRLKKYLKKEENFFLTYGDGLTNLNLNKLIKFHLKNGKIATVTAVHPPVRFGELELKGDSVKVFSEKRQIRNSWISGGFFIFNKKIFKYLKNDKTILETIPMQKLTKSKNLNAFKHNGFWQCMDTLREKKLLEEMWKKNKAPWKVK